MPAQKVLANPVVQVPYVRPGYVPRGQETPETLSQGGGGPQKPVGALPVRIHIFYIFSLHVCLLSRPLCHSSQFLLPVLWAPTFRSLMCNCQNPTAPASPAPAAAAAADERLVGRLAINAKLCLESEYRRACNQRLINSVLRDLVFFMFFSSLFTD